MRFRSTLISRAGYWPVGCGLSAYIGARYATAPFTAGCAALALLAMVYALGIAMNARYSRTRALAIGRRARTVYFSAIGRDGTLRACSIAELVDDAPPEGGVIGWDDPFHVRIHYIATKGGRDRGTTL